MTNLGSVLLVDDDAVSNYISANMLHLMHVTTQITVARNGHEALGLLREASFDLVLLDLSMPAMVGFEFLEALRQLREGTGAAAPAIVILTSSESRTDRVRAAEHPIWRYLVKPLTQGQVNRLVALVSEGRE